MKSSAAQCYTRGHVMTPGGPTPLGFMWVCKNCKMIVLDNED